eukprot:SAG31_NODE_19018_length_614_cov_1.219417_1_plen_103_part_00
MLAAMSLNPTNKFGKLLLGFVVLVRRATYKLLLAELWQANRGAHPLAEAMLRDLIDIWARCQAFQPENTFSSDDCGHVYCVLLSISAAGSKFRGSGGSTGMP